MFRPLVRQLSLRCSLALLFNCLAMDSSLSMTSTTLSTTLALLNILVPFASAHAVMNYDPNISNGTCYYAKNKQADPVYAPAGNVVFGHTYCCQLGDKLNTGTSVCVTQSRCLSYYTVHLLTASKKHHITLTSPAARILIIATKAVLTKEITPIING